MSLLQEDTSKYFSGAFFGQSVTVSSASGNGYKLKAIFEAPYRQAPVGELGVESALPSLTCATSSLRAPAEGDRVTIEGVDYSVEDIRPDGTGITRLILEKVVA